MAQSIANSNNRGSNSRSEAVVRLNAPSSVHSKHYEGKNNLALGGTATTAAFSEKPMSPKSRDKPKVPKKVKRQSSSSKKIVNSRPSTAGPKQGKENSNIPLSLKDLQISAVMSSNKTSQKSTARDYSGKRPATSKKLNALPDLKEQQQILNSFLSNIQSPKRAEVYTAPTSQSNTNRRRADSLQMQAGVVSPKFMNADISLAFSSTAASAVTKQLVPSASSIIGANAKSIVQYASKGTAEAILNKCHSRMIELGRSLEKAKCKLALAVDFNLADLFRFFGLDQEDPNSIQKGYIDCLDVIRVARYLKVMPGQGDEAHQIVQSFVRALDGDGDGELLFTDLSRAFLSAQNQEYQRLVIDRPSFYDRSNKMEQVFSAQTQLLIGEVMRIHLYIERKQSEMLRQVEVIDGGIFMQDASFMGTLVSILNSTKGHQSFVE